MRHEQCLETCNVHMSESLKHDLQDLAMLEGRAVGEYIRAVLELHVWGAGSLCRAACPERSRRESRQTMLSNEPKDQVRSGTERHP
jgi:hypothetical protein